MFRINLIIGCGRDKEKVVLSTLSAVLNVKIIRKVTIHLSPFQVPSESVEISEAIEVAE